MKEQPKVEMNCYNNFDFLDFYAIVSARRRMHEAPRNEPEMLMNEFLTKWNSSMAEWMRGDIATTENNQRENS